MIYDDIWRYMMIYDDIWWYMIQIYDDMMIWWCDDDDDDDGDDDEYVVVVVVVVVVAAFEFNRDPPWSPDHCVGYGLMSFELHAPNHQRSTGIHRVQWKNNMETYLTIKIHN